MTQIDAFIATLLCEVPIVIYLAWTSPTNSRYLLQVFIAAVSAQCITHPIAWYLSEQLYEDYYYLGLSLIELGVFIIEGIWYRVWLKLNNRKALLWSFIANFCSTALGFIFQ